MENELIKKEVINDLPDDLELSYHVFELNNQHFLFDENFFTIVKIEEKFYKILKERDIKINKLPEDFLLLIADGNFLKWYEGDLIYDENQTTEYENRYIIYYKVDFFTEEDIEKIISFHNSVREDLTAYLILFNYNKQLKTHIEKFFSENKINNIIVKVIDFSFEKRINDIDIYSEETFNNLLDNRRISYWTNDLLGSIILRIYYNFPRKKTCYWYNGNVKSIPENNKCVFFKNTIARKGKVEKCLECWAKHICPNMSCCFEIEDCNQMLKLIENAIYYTYNNSEIISEITSNINESDKSNIFHCGYFKKGA